MQVISSLLLLLSLAQRVRSTRALQVPLVGHYEGETPVDEPGTLGGGEYGFDPATLEPVGLVVNGDPANRVNLVYFGDGYTKDERGAFLQDAQFLTDTLLQPGGAFSPVADLLNVWAVFIPSHESGIGTHGRPRNTTFGLYRPGEELRAVFYAYPERVAAACAAINRQGSVGGCDEPILLGNDAFYGGLGGTPTVITASRANGVQVLRHELGHTLIPVGEEYDGGDAYFGVNASPRRESTTEQRVPWTRWLSDPRARQTGRVRMEDSRVAVQQYPWFDLSDSAYTVRFDDHGEEYPSALLRFSVSGIPREDRLTVTLDGRVVAYTFSAGHRGSLDRTWVQVELEGGLRRGQHLLKFTATVTSNEVRPMLSSVEVIEYGNEERFNKTTGHIGAYRTVDVDGGVTLRPTNEGCLMRDVTVPTFCSVCLEGLTLSLLGRVSLIESSALHCPAPPAKSMTDKRHASISLDLLNITDGVYAIRWYKGPTELEASANQTTLRIPVSQRGDATAAGWYTAHVRLRLPHVRVESREMEEQVEVWYQGCD